MTYITRIRAAAFLPGVQPWEKKQKKDQKPIRGEENRD